jgi:hypothetical protein
MAEGELVLDMCALTLPRRMQLIRAPGAPAFVNSPMARELLHWGVKNHGLAQVSWTDYLRLTVAGGLQRSSLSSLIPFLFLNLFVDFSSHKGI